MLPSTSPESPLVKRRYAVSYGVYISFSATTDELVDLCCSIATTSLVGNITFLDTPEQPVSLDFELKITSEGAYSIVIHGTELNRPIGRFQEIEYLSKFFNSMIRIYIAERSPDYVFIHAGVVSYRDQLIVLPGASFSGKTTMVSTMLEQGAEYYSDEYAVVDPSGLVHPYARKLSIRVKDQLLPKETSPEAFGSTSAKKPKPISLILLTNYQEGSIFEPSRISEGNGILESIPFVIPMRYNPDFSLKVLNTAFRRAIILKGSRDDATSATKSLIAFIDRSIDTSN